MRVSLLFFNYFRKKIEMKNLIILLILSFYLVNANLSNELKTRIIIKRSESSFLGKLKRLFTNGIDSFKRPDVKNVPYRCLWKICSRPLKKSMKEKERRPKKLSWFYRLKFAPMVLKGNGGWEILSKF